jgi:hypothetical protein
MSLCNCSTTFLDNKKQNFFVKTPKYLEYKLSGKNEDHRFGFELKDNQQFHHTKTGYFIDREKIIMFNEFLLLNQLKTELESVVTAIS